MKKVNPATTPPGNFRYRQPETGTPFESMTWQGLREQVGNHRLGEHLDLSLGWDKHLENDACEQNPQWNCSESDPILPAYFAELAATGRALWGELHGYAQAYPVAPTDADKAAARRWLQDFHNRIPNYGCGCRDHFNRYVTAWAPELQSRTAFVRWAECLHDWVNRRTAKPFWNEAQFKASPATNI
jgi:hypothetical protein